MSQPERDLRKPHTRFSKDDLKRCWSLLRETIIGFMGRRVFKGVGEEMGLKAGVFLRRSDHWP